MSIKVMTTVWEHSRASGNALLVLLAIADYADHRGRAWPSMQTIARKARCSLRRAQYNVQYLVQDLQELAITPQAGPSGCNVYRVTLRHPGNSGTPGNPDTRNISIPPADTIRGDAAGGTRGADIAGAKSAPGVPLSAEGGAASGTRSVIRSVSTKKKRGAGARKKGGKTKPVPARRRRARPGAEVPLGSDVRASQAQFVALRARLQEAEATHRHGELDDEQVGVLKKMRRALAQLQKKQAAGDFSLMDLTEFGF